LKPFKIPESVLVVIHTPQLDVLLIERTDNPGFWQSVTGSKDTADEPLLQTAAREVLEETGIDVAPGQFRDWGLVECV
jgi:dATP pyrophosphohydrolase